MSLPPLPTPPIPQNFQTYIQQVTALAAEAKIGIKLIQGVGISNVESVLTGIISSHLSPVFTLLGQFRKFVPPSLPSLPGPAGIGGIGNLNVPNCGIGTLNNNAINTAGIQL